MCATDDSRRTGRHVVRLDAVVREVQFDVSFAGALWPQEDLQALSEVNELFHVEVLRLEVGVVVRVFVRARRAVDPRHARAQE